MNMNMKEPLPEVVEAHPSQVMHLVSPIIAMGATKVVSKVLNAGYKRSTGRNTPDPHDLQVNFGRALMWAIVTAATAAVVETVMYRAMNRDSHNDE